MAPETARFLRAFAQTLPGRATTRHKDGAIGMAVHRSDEPTGAFAPPMHSAIWDLQVVLEAENSGIWRSVCAGRCRKMYWIADEIDRLKKEDSDNVG